MATMTSTIYLCRDVPLSNRYDHTLYFETKAAQRSYFLSKSTRQIDEVTYLRKSWSIRIVEDMDGARHWSYLFFRNSATGKDWFYFVTDIQYINDNTVELQLELDVIQTYMFEWTLPACFIEREHTLLDRFGENTIDEGLETGDLINAKTVEINWDDWCILIASTVVLNETGNADILGASYNGIFGGSAIYAVNAAHHRNLSIGLNALDKKEAIQSIWMYPKALVTLAEGETWSADTVYKNVVDCQLVNVPLTFNETLDGYTPKNKKLLQYPFNFLYATNNVGGAAMYRYEHFGDHTDPRVNTFGVLSPEGVAYMYPLNYKNVQHNYDEGLQISGFPQCSWNTDTYKLWLAQNQNQQQVTLGSTALQIAGGVGATIAGVASQNYVMAAGGVATAIHGVTSVQSVMAQRADMDVQPPQARGNTSASLNMVAGQTGYTFYCKCVDRTHAIAIDNFFNMYGYAVHRVKTPLLMARPHWSYIKTRDCAAYGSIPRGDLQKINQIFDAGITFWRNPANFGDYSLDNSPSNS